MAGCFANGKASMAGNRKASKRAATTKAKNDDQDTGKEETGPKAASTRSHVWGKTNPLKFPPHLYTQAVFKANYPFIKVVHGEDQMLPFSKFSLPLLVDSAVIKSAIDQCAGEITRFFKLYGKAKNEKQLVEFHHSLVRGLERVTLPTEKMLSRLDQDMLLYESQTGKKRKRIQLPDLTGFSDQLSLMLKAIEERTSHDSDGALSSNTGFSLDPEHAPMIGQDGEESNGAADMKLYVQVKRLHEYVKKLVAILEFKFTDKEQAGFQGACYACREVPVNMNNHHTNPIYIISLSERWKYSILQVRGEVSVKNGCIDPDSLPGFRQTEKLMGFKDEIPEFELASLLHERTAFYQANYSQAPNSVYPDNKYLVGTLYVSDRWRELPHDELFGCNKAETHLLYEGLLRIIIGDAVLKWNKSMVEKVIESRKAIRREEKGLQTGRFKAET